MWSGIYQIRSKLKKIQYSDIQNFNETFYISYLYEWIQLMHLKFYFSTKMYPKLWKKASVIFLQNCILIVLFVFFVVVVGIFFVGCFFYISLKIFTNCINFISNLQNAIAIDVAHHPISDSDFICNINTWIIIITTTTQINIIIVIKTFIRYRYDL